MKLSIIIPAYNEEKLVQRALDSVPLSEDYQLILINDGSIDKTGEIMEKWFMENQSLIGTKSCYLPLKENGGIAKAMNMGFDMAEGEYIVSLSADDYYIKDFNVFMPYLDGTNDLIYFDLQINNGEIWHIDEKSKHLYPGAVKFIRNGFLADTRVPDLKYREDVPFSAALQHKIPKEAFTGIVLKRYNYPHIGSLTWQAWEDDNKRR